MFVGEDHGTVCWNTPYRQAYLDLVERVVRDYDIDGIYFDTWRSGYFWPRPRRVLLRRLPQRLPQGHRAWSCPGTKTRPITRARSWPPSTATTPGTRTFWSRSSAQVRRLVKSHKNIPLIYNINNPVKMDTEDPRMLEAMDAFLYERGNSILERAEGVSLARAAGLGVWPYVGEYNNWPRVVYNGFDFQQQIFTTVMFGGAPILALPWGYVQHADNRRFVEYPVRRSQTARARVRRVQELPVRRRRVRISHAARTCAIGHVVEDGRTAFLAGRFRRLPLRARAGLVRAREHPRRSGEARRLPGSLPGGYRAPLGGAHRQHQAVRAGGRRTGGELRHCRCSIRPAKRQERFGLEELFRVAPVEPTGELAETLASYRSMTGGPYDLYLAPRPRPSLETLTPLWSFEPVKALEGGEVWRDIVTGDGLRPILPGVIVSQYGKGHVVYCASALESLFLQANNSAVGDLVRSLVAKAAPEPPPYEVDAPAALIANLTAKGDTVVLHLTNWTGNKLERAGRERVLPGAASRTFASASPCRKESACGMCRLLVDAPYRKEQTGSTLEVLIPRVEAYQAVRVDWQAAAAAAIHSDFEGGSIGPVEQVAPRHFRCGVKGEVDQEKRNRQASWYYFRVDAASGAELTIDLTDLLGEYNYKPGNLAINGATRPFISYDRKTWAALPAGALEWDAAEPRLRMRFVPSRSPVWIAHAPPYTTEDLNRLLADSKGNRNLEVEQAGKSAGRPPAVAAHGDQPRAAGGREEGAVADGAAARVGKRNVVGGGWRRALPARRRRARRPPARCLHLQVLPHGGPGRRGARRRPLQRPRL